MKTSTVSTLAFLFVCLAFQQAYSAPSPTPSAVESALRPFIDRQNIAGAVVVVATQDKILDFQCLGYADIATRRPMSADTIFWIASMSKPITGTALMMLVDEGKVNVEDPVEKYLPEFAGLKFIAEQDEDHVLLKKPRHPVLVREVASHMAGLPTRGKLDQPQGDALPLRDMVKAYTLPPLETEPGTAFNYSNPGINTVGRIVEVVSDMPFERFLDARLFKPLGMIHTTYIPSGTQMARLAKGYRQNKRGTGLEETTIGPLTHPLDNVSRNPFPAGGLFSTAGDLVKFCQMYLAGGVVGGKRYLSTDSLTAMTHKQTPETVSTKYVERPCSSTPNEG